MRSSSAAIFGAPHVLEKGYQSMSDLQLSSLTDVKSLNRIIRNRGTIAERTFSPQMRTKTAVAFLLCAAA
jgi:hypothetical protein